MMIVSLLRALPLSAATVLLVPAASHAILASPSPFAGESAGPALWTSPAPVPSASPLLLLHGMTVRMTVEGRVVVTTSRYDGGIPVANAQVTVFAPGEDEVYLTGTTDPAGFFAFVPNNPGNWRAVVDDGMGHRREARLEVGTASEQEEHGHDALHADHTHDVDHTHEAALPHTHEPEGSDRPWRLAAGLGLIFGLTGFAYGFTARRQ